MENTGHATEGSYRDTLLYLEDVQSRVNAAIDNSLDAATEIDNHSATSWLDVHNSEILNDNYTAVKPTTAITLTNCQIWEAIQAQYGAFNALAIFRGRNVTSSDQFCDAAAERYWGSDAVGEELRRTLRLGGIVQPARYNTRVIFSDKKIRTAVSGGNSKVVAQNTLSVKDKDPTSVNAPASDNPFGYETAYAGSVYYTG